MNRTRFVTYATEKYLIFSLVRARRLPPQRSFRLGWLTRNAHAHCVCDALSLFFLVALSSRSPCSPSPLSQRLNYLGSSCAFLQKSFNIKSWSKYNIALINANYLRRICRVANLRIRVRFARGLRRDEKLIKMQFLFRRTGTQCRLPYRRFFRFVVCQTEFYTTLMAFDVVW